MKKFIALILIIAMILSIGFNVFLFKPKKAKAFWGIGDITIDIVNQVKEWIVDEIPRRVARHMMIRLQQEITRWAQGGFTDENKPFAMTSWKQEITEALNVASGRFIQEFGLTPLCGPISVGLNAMLGLGLNYRPLYTEYAACTIDDILGDEGTVREFFKNPSISLYGWDTWTALAQPQNNIYGSFLLAAQRMAEIESEEIEEKEMQKDIGQGYKPEQDCLVEQSMSDEQLTKCKDDCRKDKKAQTEAGWLMACLNQCDNKNTGICLEYKTKNIGSTIHSAIEGSINSDIDWLISADEITEMFGLIFSGLFNKLTKGTGLAATPFYSGTQTISKYQAQYGYQSSYKKAQTPEDIKNLRTDILDNILNAIKRITTSSYECDKTYQLKGEVFQEIAVEILDEESQHLYVGIEGVDLKPDFEVLDPWDALLTFYGHTWDEIPFDKYPPKCEKIAGTQCKNLSTSLPYDLNIDNVNQECVTGCHETINNYRANGVPDNEAVTKAVGDGKCSSFAIGNACLQAGYLIDKTKNRCEDCVNKAQKECELISDPIKKQYCIEKHCSEYEDISNSITSAASFYNECKINSLRNNCYTCLKEYFMPAGYCHEIYDYINRAFVKYPALVYHNMWWGGNSNFDTCVGNRTDPSATIPWGLICRILPDFEMNTYGLPGANCSNVCKATPEELKDITDHKPSDADCNNAVLNLGAYHPGGQYISYLITKRSKCCAAFVGPNLEGYKKCRGITGDLIEAEEEICHPDEEGYAIATTNMNIDRGPAKISGVLDGEGYQDTVILRADSLKAADQKVTMYITRPYCDAHRVMDSWHVYWSDTNGDGSFSQKFVDIHETHPNEWLGFCKNADGSNVEPSNILCTFDIDDPNNPKDADGRPYKICSGLSSYAIQGKTKQQCLNAGVPASVCDSGGRYYTGGLYLVAKPDTPTSLGGAAWCVGGSPPNNNGNGGAGNNGNNKTCTWGKPVAKEPWCYCDEGYKPLGYTRTGGDEKGDRGGDCADFAFTSPGTKVYGYTSNQPRGDVVYIGQNACQEGQPGEQWDATGPSSVIWERETPDANSPTTYRDIDLTGQSGVLHSGVYHDDSSDEKTGWHLCAPCDSNDAGYPYYGTSYNQCTGKSR